MRIEDYTPEIENPDHIQVLFLEQLEITRGQRKAYLNVTEAKNYMEWHDAHEKLDVSKWQKKRHFKKNCPKTIRDLGLCDDARRNLYYKCWAFISWQKRKVIWKKPEVVNKALSGLEAGFRSKVEDKKSKIISDQIDKKLLLNRIEGRGSQSKVVNFIKYRRRKMKLHCDKLFP